MGEEEESSQSNDDKAQDYTQKIGVQQAVKGPDSCAKDACGRPNSLPVRLQTTRIEESRFHFSPLSAVLKVGAKMRYGVRMYKSLQDV